MRTNREKYLKFNRPPRKKLVVPDKQVVIPDPPEPQSSEPKINYLMMMAPIATASVVGFGIGMIAGNFLMSAIMVSGSFIYAAFTFVTKKREIKAYRENIQRIDQVYKQKIDQTRQELEELRKRQVLTLNKNYPELETIKKWTIQVDERLWERRPNDTDFLAFRFATGKQPAITQIKVPSADFLVLESSLVQSAHTIKDEYSKDLQKVPIVLDLKKLGALAITGKVEDSEKLAARLLCDLAVLHYPGEVDLFAICKPDSLNDKAHDKKTKWGWLKWLPHTSAVSSLGEKPHIAFNAENTKSILDQLLEEYTTRSTRKESYSKSIVLFIQDYKIVQGQEAISVLLNNGSAYGIYLIIGVPGLRQVPDGCGGALEVDGTAAVLQFLKSGEKSLQGRAEFAEINDCEVIARNLIKVSRGDSNFDLPSDVRFLELLGYESADTVNFELLWEQAWKKQPSLETIIGIKRGKQKEIINLRQHAHGPHGLIAGATRSGKSELLQTILAGFALKHHPHQLNFVLVDYKGGTSLAVLEDLPHTVGLVTDLDGRQTLRALASLERELERREEILAKYKVADLDKYYQQGYAEKETLPYLLIVIDEFAELRNKFRDDFQAVMGRFVSLAQRGGGLGVHLMLAMQSPEGVVDDKIRANTKYRICLRVESDGESRSLLQKPDAARVTVQGRGYFQVGKDIVYDLFQVARVAGYYHQDESGQVENEYKIYEIMTDGQTEVLVDSTSERSKDQNKASKTDVQLLVANAYDTAKRLKLKKLNSPWPPSLPSVLPLPQVLEKAELLYWNKQAGWPETSANDEKWMAVPVGLLDEPKKQKQPPLIIDLMGDSTNTFLMGAPAQGKTNFLLVLATALTLRYTPDDINLHLIDFSTGQLESIAQFPHVTGRYRLSEKEKVQRLLYILQKELATRQEMCNDANAPDLQALLRQKPDAKLPVLLTLIDNFPKFREIFQMETPAWESLMRDGGKYGLCFAFVSDKLPSDNFLNLARARGAFYLTDHSYSSIVGNVDKTLEEQLPGRGFWVGKPPLQFHFALPTDGTRDEQLSNLQKLMKEMRASWKGNLPTRVELLGDVELTEIISGDPEPIFKPLETSEDFQVPIALDYATHQPIGVNLFRESPYYLVIGPQGSGDVESLMALILSAALHYRPEDVQFALIGLRSKGGIMQLKDLPHVIRAAHTPAEITETLAFIEEMAKERREALKDKAPDFYFKPVTILAVDDYARFAKSVEQKLLDKLSEVLTGRGHMLGIAMIASINSFAAKNLRSDSLFRAIKESRNGIFLSPADASNADFSDIVKVPDYMRGKKDVPAGRGILYNPGASPQPFVHVAIKGMDNPEMVASWVEKIKKRSG